MPFIPYSPDLPVTHSLTGGQAQPASGSSFIPYSQNMPTPAPAQAPQVGMLPKPDILHSTISQTGQDYQKGLSNFTEQAGMTGNSVNKNPLIATGENALAATGSAINTIFSPITNAIKSTADSFAESSPGVYNNPVVGKLLDLFGAGSSKLDSWATQHPEAARNLSGLLTVGGTALAGGEKGLDKPIGTVKGVVNTLDSGAGKIIDAADALKSKVIKPPEDLQTSAIKDTTPTYNKNLIGEPPVKGTAGETMPRVSEAKGLKTRTVNSTQSEIEAGKELSKVEGYKPKDTALNKYNLAQDTIGKKGQALETSLKNEKILRPPKEVAKVVKTAVNGASQDSLLLQKTDPIVKNYIRVTERAIAQNDGTLSGELGVRKALDQAYEDAGGKYGNNKGLDQIHRAARNALNDDLEAHAQSTEVKQALKEQSNLYRASDVLKDKAVSEGGSKLEQFIKKHPVVTKSVKAAGRAVGIGAGVHLAP